MCSTVSPKFYEVLTPAAPCVAEMLGATVLFKHENGYLFPGLHTGVVTAYEEDKRGDAWLTVKSPSFVISVVIHESYLKGYARHAEGKAAVA